MQQATAVLKREKEIQKVLQELPGSFGDALVYLMKWVEITVEDFAEKSLVSTRKIQRMRNDIDYPKNIESVVDVCIGMHLPPELSNALISRSGFSLKLVSNEAHLQQP